MPPETELEDDATPASDEQDPARWQGDGWTARIIKNEEDDGWAVEMTQDGQSEPSLVSPWTMGRDKKNPKPIDSFSFATLVKTADEVLARHAQARRAQLHRQVNVRLDDGARLRVDLDVVPDEDDPHAILTVRDAADEIVSRTRVSAGYRLSAETARRWLERGGEPEA